MNNIKKVFVIHKTHFDMGFTDYASVVMDKYLNDFVPKAIDVAKECNKDGEKRFIWTVGSYIIKYVFENGSEEQVKQLDEAIRDGNIVWHSLSCTTHTELMTDKLLQYSIDIAHELNAKYGKECIAAKMTDVPCHTIAMVPVLARNNIKYLHIGINHSSMPIDVPILSVLKYGDDEVILNYVGDYGDVCVIGEYAIEFAHTVDNTGPPTVEGVDREMERLAVKYPNAEIVSSSMDDFAHAIMEYKDTFPVITQELGDTWIHGSGTDPYKTSLYMELVRLADKMENSENYNKYMENLLLIAEHTWGMDVKRHFRDFKNWDKADFVKAHEADIIPVETYKISGRLISEFIEECFETDEIIYRDTSYSAFEKSWAEQREYITNAINLLPDDLKAYILSLDLQPEYKAIVDEKETSFTVNGWEVEVLDDGSLKVLAKNGKKYNKTILGNLNYSTFSYEETFKQYYRYNVKTYANYVWSYPDFAKPGYEFSKTDKSANVSFKTTAVSFKGNTIVVEVIGDAEMCQNYGCPRKAQITYKLEDKAYINVKWFEKDANKMPEAVTFGFKFDSYKDLALTKVGRKVDPFNVIMGGNRRLHACMKAEAEAFSITNLHSPLLAVGENGVYGDPKAYGDIENGLNYVLFNNRWSTNFRIYYSENASFDYEVEIG